MNILFYCPFKFDIRKKNLTKLGGIENLNYELCNNLSKTKFKIYLATNCKKIIKVKRLTNIPINKLINKTNKFKFDIIVSSNDTEIFDYYKYSKKILWLHNTLSIEKALRKKRLYSIFKHKINAVFVSKYLESTTSKIYNFKSRIVIPNFLDKKFENLKLNIKRKPIIVWSVQRSLGLDETIKIWIKKIYLLNPSAELHIFAIKKYKDENFYKNYNIFFHGRVSKQTLIKYYSEATAMICLGYDETFCINIIEAFACGLPVITFGFTAVSELVNNKNSFKMNNFNDFEKIIFNILNMKNFKRKDYINYCYEYSKRYHLKKILPLWKKIIRS